MMVGDWLYLDIVNIDTSEHTASIVDRPFCAYNFNWPYFTFGSKDNHLFVINVFSLNEVQRFQMPKSCSRITCTQITDS